LTLLITTVGVVGIPQMVFTNPKMTIHVNRTIDRPLMRSMVVGKYKSANVMHPRGGHREPIVVIESILDHRIGHYVKPNRVVLKYLDFKKDVDLDVHVKVFNFVVE
jgi:hypothetical protein